MGQRSVQTWVKRIRANVRKFSVVVRRAAPLAEGASACSRAELLVKMRDEG